MITWLEQSIGTCQENVGLNERRDGMTMFQRVCLKMRITNFYGTSVCEQTMKYHDLLTVIMYCLATGKVFSRLTGVLFRLTGIVCRLTGMARMFHDT